MYMIDMMHKPASNLGIGSRIQTRKPDPLTKKLQENVRHVNHEWDIRKREIEEQKTWVANMVT